MTFFTSESVSEGHPDKIADQISDAVLDSILSKDKNCAVACETMIKNSLIIVSGEIKTDLWVDLEKIVYEVIKNIGYDDISKGLNADNLSIINLISKQSKEIHDSVFDKSDNCIGAGDQGIMFGYACDETESYMPAPIYYANKLLVNLAKKRKSGEINWLRPDSKSQVTVQYNDGKVLRIDSVLISTQHKENISQKEIRDIIINDVIKKSVPAKYLDEKTNYIINPSGSFIIGGPYADCGLTGRKVIVDAYGGYARHGGGAFSGKDPSKVDRSASYMARYIAKNIVAAKIASRCEVQLSYGIGISKPLSIYVNTFGTSRYLDDHIIKIIKENFDLSPKGIIDTLNLKNINYFESAAYGHFGREGDNFTWEKLDMVEKLRVL
ncbi:methionine adenosyltransferase [Rickettsiales endosymbiont of Trichoplax sp. H2]|uniref:methionine adenosyltransferase n=1 Tax=Rickettsiales endosymbiont of Trichoplax sp. H2 TaxID=2021221 RepID=UPI0012B1CD65|nr:methionine adenosyltransferase [Rickettsiales endosymbiont of Trichoplax sp. H2]MSO14267.1 S-adenosylmethionine synthase [Rickettsiales endosymbiont of Trichoplax sp. H2]